MPDYQLKTLVAFNLKMLSKEKAFLDKSDQKIWISGSSIASMPTEIAKQKVALHTR